MNSIVIQDMDLSQELTRCGMTGLSGGVAQYAVKVAAGMTSLGCKAVPLVMAAGWKLNKNYRSYSYGELYTAATKHPLGRAATVVGNLATLVAMPRVARV